MHATEMQRADRALRRLLEQHTAHGALHQRDLPAGSGHGWVSGTLSPVAGGLRAAPGLVWLQQKDKFSS